jgi:hypothetical protein
MEATGRLLFVGAVTCYLLARVFSGDAAAAEIVVYGATAAFGLEFILASWGELWRGSPREG